VAPIVVTPATTGAGSFSPASVTLTANAPMATCVFTPSTSGSMLIGLTNGGGLQNPKPVAYESRIPAPSGGSGNTKATTLGLAGPLSGIQGQPSGAFTVSADGNIVGTVVATPTSSGAGTFKPTSVTLTPDAPTATFVYTPSTSGYALIGLKNNSSLGNPAALPYESRVPAPGGGTGKPAATALYLAGPVSGKQYQASTAFTVSANGTIGGPVVVTPATSGMGSFTPKTVTLTADAATATFVFTPSSTGSMSITLANSGTLANPKALSYDSRAATPDSTRTPPWTVDVNPARPFGNSQGVVPNGVVDKAGAPNLVIASVETVMDDTVVQYKLWQRYNNITPTELQKGEATPTFPMLRRVPDPTDSTKWAYHHRINKKEVGIDGVRYTPENVPDSYRSEVSSTGDDRFTPTGTEEFVICGIQFPEYWRILDTRRDWYVFFQMHDSDNGLTGNPPLALGWTGGNGNPSNCKFNWVLRRYNNPNWPASQTPKLNRAVYSGTIANPAANTWHWLIFHYRSGCGYLDPKKGAIYGPTNPNDCFVKLYHAVGNGAANLAGSYTGFWGSPYPSNDPRIQSLAPGRHFPQNGFWKNGVYLNTKFQPASAGDNRDLYSKGHRIYRASDTPGLTVADVLRDFRGV